jgi:hypothetical protein
MKHKTSQVALTFKSGQTLGLRANKVRVSTSRYSYAGARIASPRPL